MVRGLCSIIITLTVASAHAIADSREKLEAWINVQRELDPIAAFENSVLRLALKTPPQMSATALKELRAQIAKFPDHPSHADVQAEEYRQRDGGTIVECQVFLRSAGNWRISETNTWEQSDLRYVDTCLRSDRAWRLIPTQLRIVDPRSGFPENSDYRRLEGEYARTLHCLLNGGIGLLADARVLSTHVADGRWSARIGTDEREVEFTGSWMVHEGQTHFLTSSRRITRNPIAEYVGQTEVFSGWKWNDQIARPLATQMEVRKPDHRVDRVITLQDVRPLPADEFERVTITPQVGASDAIRGPATYTSVWDHRPDVGRISYPGSPDLTERIPDHTTRSRQPSMWGWILAAAIAAILIFLRTFKRSASQINTEHARATPGRPGFTLIETLLSISLIAILISLFIPSLSKVRGIADRSRSIQTLGTLAKGFASYTSDFRDYMPYFTDPKATYSVVYHDGIGMQVEYFGAYYTWHIALGERSFGAPSTSPVYYTPQEQPRHGLAPTSFWYSASFLADPAYWNMETRIGPEQWRSTRLAEVIFPSSKAVLLDGHSWFNNKFQDPGTKQSITMLAFIDASAELLNPDEVLGGYPNGTGPWHGNAMLTYPAPGIVTIDGVRGRDR